MTDDSTYKSMPDKSKPDEGKAGVAAMLAEAEQQPDSFLRTAASQDPVPGQAIDGIAAGQWKPDEYGLPPDCPVLPLGTAEGDYYFLNTIGEMRVLGESKFSKNTINSLFARRERYLYWAWPQINKDGKITGFQADKARESLMGACADKGPFDPIANTRGRGAWLGPKSNLILHCGNCLIENGDIYELGEIGGNVYPTRPPIQRPWPKTLREQTGPALELLTILKSWQWERPEVDPILFLGWIASAMIGGALDHRPTIFIVGDKATGKSSLQQILHALFGHSLIHTSDTTEAGISQLMKYDSLPVAIDEFEAKADNRRTKAIIELARASYSGDVKLRGGDNHKGTQFNARSAFLFSAINTPPLDPQDMSRLAILFLKRFPPDAVAPVIDRDKFNRLGRMIQRRMIDNWHRWPQTLQAYYEVLSDHGHGGRGQDTFGTLLACADMVMDVDAEELGVEMAINAPDGLAIWGQRLRPQDMFEYEGAEENWRFCLNHILSARIDAWRGGSRTTVGRVLADYWQDNATQTEGGITFERARELLQETGLSLQRPRKASPDVDLFIPNQNPLLHELFKGSKWAGSVDAGGWAPALRQAPADSYRLAQGKINGVHSKGTVFALKNIMAGKSEPDESDQSEGDGE